MWHSKTFTIIAVVCVIIFGLIAGMFLFDKHQADASEDISAEVADIVTHAISESSTEPTRVHITEPETDATTETTTEPNAEPETKPTEIETEPYIEPTVEEIETTAAVTEPITEPEETETTEPITDPTSEPEINQDELEMLAIVIYQEVGGDAACDECRYRVGDVVLNRVADPRFHNSIYEVLVQPGQYGRLSWTGVVWADRATNPGEAHAVARAYRVAEDLLRGNHSDLYGAGYVWQAGFVQGVDNIYCCGHYFGR